MRGQLWSREELILSLELYCSIDFGDISTKNLKVIELAKLCGRSVNSIALRLANYTSCDPVQKERGIVGMTGGLTVCQPIWDEFYGKWDYLKEEAIKARIKLAGYNVNENISQISQAKECDEIVKYDLFNNFIKDINNHKFYDIINRNYNGHCIISGLKVKNLLMACHILPEDNNVEKSMKASNGLLLNISYAKAYSDGLIGIDKNYKLHIAPNLKKRNADLGYSELFPNTFESKNLILHDAIVKPEPTLLEWHMDTIFNRQAV